MRLYRGGAVMLRKSWTEADDKSFLTFQTGTSWLFLLHRIILTRTHFICFAASLKMSKQSRITFSLNLNVNLFLTRVFSIYIQFVPLRSPGRHENLQSCCCCHLASYTAVSAAVPAVSVRRRQCCSEESQVRTEPESPGQWRHTLHSGAGPGFFGSQDLQK